MPSFAVVDRRRVDAEGNARPGQPPEPKCAGMHKDGFLCVLAEGHGGMCWVLIPGSGKHVVIRGEV